MLPQEIMVFYDSNDNLIRIWYDPNMKVMDTYRNSNLINSVPSEEAEPFDWIEHDTLGRMQV